jgi:hypothetical protein
VSKRKELERYTKSREAGSIWSFVRSTIHRAQKSIPFTQTVIKPNRKKETLKSNHFTQVLFGRLSLALERLLLPLGLDFPGLSMTKMNMILISTNSTMPRPWLRNIHRRVMNATSGFVVMRESSIDLDMIRFVYKSNQPLL